MQTNFIVQLPKWRLRLNEIERELSQPTTYASKPKAAELAREHARFQELCKLGAQLESVQKEIAASEKLLLEPGHNADFLDLARNELTNLKDRQQMLTRAILAALLPPDPKDSRNTILEIRAAAGGEESALFVVDLFRMYSRYAEMQGWKSETMDTRSSDLGGLKEAVMAISGLNVFKKLRYESGVHRVQRIPTTEAGGRIHTSTVTVAVLPEAEELDIEIKPEDLRIEVCRSSGPGGQGVNTTDSAVQILHIPTGLIVKCQDSRSQIQNKASALRVLRARLLKQKQREEEEKYAFARRSQIGTGERNERIRTYNFPQNRVTDHRINLTLYNLTEVLEGKLDLLIEPLLAKNLEERLRQIEAKE